MKNCTKQNFQDWLAENQEVSWIKEIGVSRILSCVDDEVSICDAESESEFDLLNDIREMFYAAHYSDFKPNLSGRFF